MVARTYLRNYPTPTTGPVLPRSPTIPISTHYDTRINPARTRGGVYIPNHFGSIETRIVFDFKALININETITLTTNSGTLSVSGLFVDAVMSFLELHAGSRIYLGYYPTPGGAISAHVGIVTTPITEVVTVRDGCHYDLSFEMIITDTVSP
jgi:hypothetical protein